MPYNINNMNNMNIIETTKNTKLSTSSFLDTIRLNIILFALSFIKNAFSSVKSLYKPTNSSCCSGVTFSIYSLINNFAFF